MNLTMLTFCSVVLVQADAAPPDASRASIERTYDISLITDRPRDATLPSSQELTELGLIPFEVLEAGWLSEHDEERIFGLFGERYSGWSGDLGLWRSPGLTPEDLADWIERNIAPGTWKGDRSIEASLSIRKESPRLVVVHEERVHEQIRSHLARLRADRTKLFKVDIWIAPVTSLDAVSRQVGDSLSRRDLREIAQQAGEHIRQRTSLAHNRQVVGILDGNVRSMLARQSLNSTGPLPVPSHRHSQELMGLLMTVQPRLLPGGSLIQLAARIYRFAPAGGREVRKLVFGELEVLPRRTETVDHELVVIPDQTFVVARLDPGADSSGEAILARVSPLDLGGEVSVREPPPSAATAESFERDHDIEPLLRAWGIGQGEEYGFGDYVEAQLRRDLPGLAWDSEELDVYSWGWPTLRVRANSRAQRAIEDWLHETARRALRSLVVHLACWEGPASGARELVDLAASHGGTLPVDWTGVATAAGLAPRYRFDWMSAAGHSMDLESSTTRHHYATIMWLPGGCFIAPPVSQPQAPRGGGGLRFVVSTRRTTDSKQVLLKVDLARSRARFDRQREVAALISATTDEELRNGLDEKEKAPWEGFFSLLSTDIPLDLPDYFYRNCRVARTVPVGKYVVLACDAIEAGRNRVVVARIAELEPAEDRRD